MYSEAYRCLGLNASLRAWRECIKYRFVASQGRLIQLIVISPGFVESLDFPVSILVLILLLILDFAVSCQRFKFFSL